MATEQTRRGAVIVTGGTGAIGSSLVGLLASGGGDLAFTYRSNADKAAAVARAYDQAGGGRVLARALDLTDASASAAFIDEVAAELGAIGGLVHAGGPHVPQRYLSTIAPEQFRRHVDEELLAFYNLASAALPHLRETAGAIVAITTVAVRKYPIRDALSSSPKAAIESLVRAIAAEEGRYGVRANCVGPGIMSDGMAAALADGGDFDEAAQAAALRAIPLRRFGAGRDCAELARFLLSDRAGYITGQTIDVDGGYSL